MLGRGLQGPLPFETSVRNKGQLYAVGYLGERGAESIKSACRGANSKVPSTRRVVYPTRYAPRLLLYLNTLLVCHRRLRTQE